MDRTFLNEVFAKLQAYLEQSLQNNNLENSNQILKQLSPHELKKILPNLSSDGVSEDQLIKDLEMILQYSVRTIHPLFLNQLCGGFDEAAWMGEVVASLLNPTMSTYEMSPVLTLMEKQVISELLKLVGLENGEGIMTTGGSNSNLIGVLCARSEYNPNIRINGFGHNRYRVYVSSECHYSFDKAVNIAGIGTQNLVMVPVNSEGEMIPEELERILISDLKEGLVPLMVGATLGTTVLGAFDPIKEIARICERHQVWLHVDAAWGGGAFFSRSLRTRIEGIDLADSIAFDAHKTMGTSLMTSFFLTKHQGTLRSTSRGGGTEYLFHDYEFSDWDTGTYSLQCGRRGDILKMWYLWRSHGTNGLSQRIERLLQLSTFATKLLDEHPRFKLIHSHYLNVCFQVLPSSDSLDQNFNLNLFNVKVREKILEDGHAMINYAHRPDGTIFFRLVFPNHQTQENDIEKLVSIILIATDKVENDHMN